MTNSGLVMALRLDQRRRWEQGEHVRVETYLEEQPGLRDDPDALLDLIYGEVVLREEYGGQPRLTEYLERFPHLAGPLRLQFEVHEALEDSEELDPAGLRDRSSLTEVALHLPGPRSARSNGTDRVPATGVTVAGYEVLAELGRGGMGVVYKARQPGLHRLVALKMILGGSHSGPEERKRFRTEAEAAGRLQHPNIVHVYEVGEHEGCPFLSMELVEGPSLDRYGGGRPVPPREAAEIVKALARAMHHAHERGIVHRDLKPGNVLLGGEGAPWSGREEHAWPGETGTAALRYPTPPPRNPFMPKITDFGLAKLLDTQAGRTPTGAFLGTPAYMAPEQAFGRAQDVGPAADIYALGAILYELLTGRPPFQGDNPVVTIDQVRHREPVPPRRRRSGVPRDLDTICLHCLEKDPRRRYTSALALAEDLHRFLTHESIHARPATAVQRLAKWVRRRPAVAGLIAVLAAGLLSLPGVVWWHDRDKKIAGDLAKTQEQEKQKRDQKFARQLYGKFLEEHDAALFNGIHGIFFADVDAVRYLREARSKARDALGRVGVRVGGKGQPVLGPGLSPLEYEQVRTGSQQLLLLLAESIVAAPRGPPPGAPPEEPADRLKEALRLVDSAMSVGRDTPACHLQRARYLDMLGQPEAAKEEERRARSVRPVDVSDYFLLGYELYLRERFVEAAADFHDALVLRPGDFWSLYFLALCRIETGPLTEARTCLDRCVELRRDFVLNYLLRADVAERMRDDRAAERDYRAAFNHPLNADAEYMLYIKRGYLRLRRGQAADAVTDFQAARIKQPDRYAAYMGLAKARHSQGRLDEAGRWLKEALDRRPKEGQQARVYGERLAGYYFETGQYRAAVDACDAALRAGGEQTGKRPRRDLLLVRWKAAALLKLGRYREAVAAFDSYAAVSASPGTDFYRLRGRARVALGDFLGAVSDYGAALAPVPDAELLTHRGWAYCFLDSWKPALADFEAALRLDKNQTDAYVGRGLARVMLPGDYRAAVADADEALRRGPTTPEMMHNVACTLALASARAEHDTAAPDGRQVAASWRARAVEVVRQALVMVPAAERGRFWRDKVLPDRALDALRGEPSFKELGRERPGGRAGLPTTQ
jgi:serine/threonine protein kinase/tetratricopeptide (TPR) repeat protein